MGLVLAAKALKFVDRDEHVYFWFPLLAGLSELTFDPRCVTALSAKARVPGKHLAVAVLEPNALCVHPEQCGCLAAGTC